MAAENPQHPELVVLARVLCLECGFVYGKPTRGGTLSENPGCPRCGYVGWIALHSYGDADAAAARIRRVG